MKPVCTHEKEVAMPKMILSLQGPVIKEVALLKEKTTLGRRPYNDIVIDNLAVSGEHARFILDGNEVIIEDCNSTNGTYVNGRAVEKQMLNDGDQIEVGKYSIAFVADPVVANQAQSRSNLAGHPITGHIRVLSGPGSGRELALTKEVTTLGKPGVAVAAVTRKSNGFEIALVGGKGSPTVNGQTFSDVPRPLSNGDLIELAGSTMQFIQPEPSLLN
jgi:pSer/pThr/pTyr-binding forkhead associated (FHA) protein